MPHYYVHISYIFNLISNFLFFYKNRKILLSLCIHLTLSLLSLSSRYTKNLSPDKVNLSTFKGEGELTNLQLDENVLTDLLELPNWLRLTSAWCNQVSFRISWTKLKSVPITLVSCFIALQSFFLLLNCWTIVYTQLTI